MAESLDNVRLSPDGTSVILLDQSLLPGRVEERQVRSLDAMVDAIRALRVRGAPAIGVAAALGIYLLANRIETEDFEEFYQKFTEYKDCLLYTSRCV